MKKSLIIGLTVLSVMMFAGTAYSVEGPSPIVVFPFICEVPTGMLPVNFEHLDMFYTIANASFFEVQPLGMNVLVKVRSYKGDILLNDSMHLSIRDVGRQTCSGEIGKMQAANRSQMVQTVGGKQYYVGYIEYAVSDPASGEKIIGWGEMETLRTQKVGSIGGSLKLKEWLYTDAGFNGVPDFYDDAGGSVFNGYYITSNLGLLPRYNIANADPDTHNWWIIMTPSNAQRPPDGTCGRILGGTICNEDEVCLGTIIDIPYQVNIIDVTNLSRPSDAGWAQFAVQLFPDSSDGENPCGNAANEQYVGWSYIYTVGDFNLKTALIFPIHTIVGVAQ